MKTGDHILNLSCTRSGAILTNGEVFASCSCRTWKCGPAPRAEARMMFDVHFDAANEAEQAKKGEPKP